MSALDLLDTNTVGYILNRRSQAARIAMQKQIKHSQIAISTVSEAEMLFGLAKKPEAARLRNSIETFFSAVQILPWDSAAAMAYGTLRARLSAAGKALSQLDMMIAAHALATDAVLVTADKAFSHVEALRPTLNWATDI